MYRAMLADVRDKEIDVVVAWASDRLHRRLSELVEFVQVVLTAGAGVATVTSRDVDLATPHGRMLAGILGSLAQAEVEQRVCLNREPMNRGPMPVHRFSRRAYGYNQDGNSAIPHEADVLERCAQAVLAGASLRENLAELNRAGEQTSTGSPWSVPTLRRVLLKPRNACLNHDRDELLGQGDWPAIISEEVHHALVAHLMNPSRRLATTHARKSSALWSAACAATIRMPVSAEVPPSDEWVTAARKPHNSRRMELVDEVIEAVVIGVYPAATPRSCSTIQWNPQVTALNCAHRRCRFGSA